MAGSWSVSWALTELLVVLLALPVISTVMRSIRSGDAVGPELEQGPSISVVIPARNEAGRLAPLLESLQGAVDVVEVIVVDDESTDDTARVASSFGVKVVMGTARPQGWVGKPWALRQGLEVASGEWVVTLDADTRVAPTLPRALVAQARRRDLALVTAAGSFECPTFGAQWIHPALLTTLVYRYGRPDASRNPDALANGQCMAFRREDAIGNGYFEAVRGELIEDVALARWLHRKGSSVALVDASEMLTVRMFETFGSTVSGWGRSLSMASLQSRTASGIRLVALATSQVLPVVFIITGLAPVAGGFLLALRIGTLFGTGRAYVDRRASYWLSPVADVIAWVVVALGTIRHFVGADVSWRGRSYQVRQSD